MKTLPETVSTPVRVEDPVETKEPVDWLILGVVFNTVRAPVVVKFAEVNAPVKPSPPDKITLPVEIDVESAVFRTVIVSPTFALPTIPIPPAIIRAPVFKEVLTEVLEIVNKSEKEFVVGAVGMLTVNGTTAAFCEAKFDNLVE